MYQETLTQAGLSNEQAAIYEVLLKIGPSPARKISQNSAFKRSLVYKILDELVAQGLATKKDEIGKVSIFEPAHPMKLKEFTEKKAEAAKQAQNALDGILGELTSSFNLISGKPGVQFFEGIEGVKKVLEDTLSDNPQKQLLTFSDVAGYANYLPDWNTDYYAPKRKRLGIHERVIIPDNPKALEWMKNYKANEVTEILFVSHKTYPFTTEINIYNNKVSFVTFSEKTHIGVIVQNQEIYQTLTSMFNGFWNLGKAAFQTTQPSWLQSAPKPQPTQLV